MRVVYNNAAEDYEQWVATKKAGENSFHMRVYNSDMKRILADETECRFSHEVPDYWKPMLEARGSSFVLGHSCNVLTNKLLGDCTNSGISALRSSLFLVGRKSLEHSPVEHLLQAVIVKQTFGVLYCEPVVFRSRWYSFGGNYLDTALTDLRRTVDYPIAIHDRYEGGQAPKKPRHLLGADNNTI